PPREKSCLTEPVAHHNFKHAVAIGKRCVIKPDAAALRGKSYAAKDPISVVSDGETCCEKGVNFNIVSLAGLAVQFIVDPMMRRADHDCGIQKEMVLRQIESVAWRETK